MIQPLGNSKMEIIIKGITEEEYGLWFNGIKDQEITKRYTNNGCIITRIGFNLEDIKNFELDMNHNEHVFFIKVHNDKTYDVYREHLITLIKMLILNKKRYSISIYIVSDKYQDYKNELTNFYNLNTHYEKNNRYGQYISLLKCFCMRFIGFNITNLSTNAISKLSYLVKKIRNDG